jgi:hypothetical protein
MATTQSVKVEDHHAITVTREPRRTGDAAGTARVHSDGFCWNVNVKGPAASVLNSARSALEGAEYTLVFESDGSVSFIQK